jgi:hypothetical protein
MLEGSMDLNALWFSDGDEEADEKPETAVDPIFKASSLRGKDKTLNMSGSEVAWDAYAKIKTPGFKSEEEKEDTLIKEGGPFDSRTSRPTSRH